jgi:uncharacterized protein (DUF885 family)
MRNTNSARAFLRRGTVILCACLVAGLLALALQGKQRPVSSPGLGAQQSQMGPIPGEADSTTRESEMRGFIERYAADRASLNRYFAVQGPEWSEARESRSQRLAAEMSPAYQARMKEFDTEWTDRLEKLNFDAMREDGRIDFLVLQNYLAHDLRQLDIRAKTIAEAGPLMPYAQAILDLEDSRRRMGPVDSRQAAEILNQLKQQVEETRRKLEAQIQPAAGAGGQAEVAGVKKTAANRAAVATEGLRNILKTWFGFYNGYDPAFTWWVDQPYKALDKALESYTAFLREKVVGIKPGDESVIVGDPIGRDALLSELAHEMIPYTPEELIAIANQEFGWCEAEMKRAAREMGYGDDWHKALEAVKKMHIEPGQQPELIRKLMYEAIDFIEQRNLITVPELARETLRMEMISPERQLINPFFSGGEVISVSYPTNTMSEDDKLMSMRGNNIPFARATVFHEMIPGHHLEGFMSARYHRYRRVFQTPFWEEGWALYWELRMWDLDFARTPADRIGMLFWRMHRCARIIFSLSFHLAKMTPDECIDFLVNRVGHERANAAAEVRRSFDGSAEPLYQCAYLLGGLQIRALHHELVASGKMTERAFHDRVLKENSIPIEMIRADLTGQKLSRDFHSSWRFYTLETGGTASAASR